jgi:hypothetical protein
MKVAYLTRGGTIHDRTWASELSKYFDVWTFDRSDPTLHKDVRPDIIQAGPLLTDVIDWALYAKRLWDSRLVAMSWAFDVLETPPSAIVKQWQVINHADILLCDSAVVHNALLAQREPPFPPSIQFPWGVDLEMFSPDTDPPTNVFIARERGLSVMQRAFVIANKPWFTTRMRHTSMPAQYRMSWAYACASPSDGSSVSLLEAMACGLPVIVSDIAGNREWVTHGVNGWLCKHDDPQAFADAIVECASMTVAERKQMGEANRAVVEARADWHANFEKLVEAYHAIVGK